MRFIVLFLFIVNALFLSGQVSDNFSDGDFSNNPIWIGDNAQFKINAAAQLQLNSIGTDTSLLSTYNQLLVNTQWEFYIKLTFNTSSNNFARVYLTSDTQDLHGNVNGYFVQIGSTADDISLYRQDGNQEVLLVNSPSGLTATTSNEFKIKVLRHSSGLWELMADPNAGIAFQNYGSTIDTTYKTSSFFGVFCKYTTTNSTRFYFDDFKVQTIQVDTFPPKLVKLKVVSSNQIDLFFDEPLDTITASNPINYLINNNIGVPVFAIVDNLNASIVHLVLGVQLQLGAQYLITIDNIKDVRGNIMKQQQIFFPYYIAQSGDIVINEIMADPSPVVGLPDAEYLELYNTSKFPIPLINWQLAIGSSLLQFPDSILKTGDFLLVCHDDNFAALSNFGKVISFSSFSLVNSGTQITLKDQKGGLIHQVKYSDSWYGQSSKIDGGWSLEQIDGLRFCSGASNWWASNDIKGGTPGHMNSVDAANPDISAPQIDRIAVVDSVTVLVVFSETIDSTGLSNVLAYNIIDSIGFPLSVNLKFPNYNTATLSLSKSLKKGIIYKLQIKDSLSDCAGNILQINTTLPFGIAEKPEKNDLVINELLFNSRNDGVDYVEIYNRSNKIIDFNGLRLANFDLVANDFSEISIVTTEPFAIFPQDYFVLTTEPEIVKSQYFCRNANKFIAMSDFPSLTDAEGNIYLITASQNVIDSLQYTESMQFSMLNSFDGVSLERINFNQLSMDNWHSASETVGFGTPTYLNSQYSENNEAKGEFSLMPEIFSPDNDGFDDVLSINYQLTVGTVISKILIYDAAGRKIRNLTSNLMVGTSGTLYWDGITDQNSKAEIGIYIVLIETINPSGTTAHFKLIVTLAGKL